MTTTPREFQIATVKAAITCLKGKGRRRFLVADEVGLGKTLVARELVRRLSADGIRPVIVYYITSNTKVSDQNAERLVDFLGDAAKQAVSPVDRLGLIPLEGKKRPGLRLYPLAPLTSFPSLSARPQTGKAGERAFIARLLGRCYPGLEERLPHGFMQQRAVTSWTGVYKTASTWVEALPAKFVAEYRRALVREFGHNVRKKIADAACADKPLRQLARLRRPLAEACLLATPPDLVIFDEFQRYRELLRPAENDRLVRALVDGKNGRGPAVLLLSATPYRLYSEAWESSTQVQPHRELFDIIEFLGGKAARSQAETLFDQFGAILRRIGRAAGEEPDANLVDHARAVRSDIQALLRPMMARTERHDPADLDWEGTHHPSQSLRPSDLKVFRHFVEGVPEKLKTAALPYWLSVPLPAQSLGIRYKISDGVTFMPDRSVPALTAARRPRGSGDGWGSAKLRALLEVSPVHHLALPWVAPSLSWWPLAGGWSKAPSPKVLLFSRFRATPQSVAALTSLEVEQRYAHAVGISYSQAWAKRKLQAKVSQGATLALFHPSPFLIRVTDPLKGRFATPAQARLTVKRQLAAALGGFEIPIRTRPKTSAKRRLPGWHVLAAVEKASGDFEDGQASWEAMADDDGVLADLLGQRAAVPRLEWISSRELNDLADMALGGPAIAAGRAWLRHYDCALGVDGHSVLTRFCWHRLRHYLDNPVFWGRVGDGKPTNILQTAIVDGGFESLLDEHFWLARARVSPGELIADLHEALGAASGWFTFKQLPAGPGGIRIRCHAAVPFGGTDATEDPLAGDDRAKPVRSQELRRAFNAPFWPHVLATTSVGQEGLDFHSWCDRIAHWDLPSNPVDLEQREGRISRFGGLVVRRPLGILVGPAALAATAERGGSPWCHLEKLAEKDHADTSGLSPWWLLKGAAIRRYVFSLPQSRDVARFKRLRRQRLLYRLALGQPNQEDLVDLLMSGGEDRAAALAALTLDLAAYRAPMGGTDAAMPD
ncbi:helicase-related protein [Mesorhizobium sp. M0006]|uniref:helicase-related protein n=1 Tax=Mesorhizobium sp. M0006 TaxID=2956838 RepID=UPI0033357D36